MVKKFIRNIAFKLVGKKTPEQKKLERLGFIRELLAIQKLLKNASKPEDLLGNIAKNFLVEKVMVSKKDGTVLMASGEDSFERAVKTSSLIELINNEFPDTRFFMVKDAKGYKIFYLKMSTKTFRRYYPSLTCLSIDQRYSILGAVVILSLLCYLSKSCFLN